MMSKITVVVYSENPVWLQKTTAFFEKKNNKVALTPCTTIAQLPKHPIDCFLIHAQPSLDSFNMVRRVHEVHPIAGILWICQIKNAGMFLDFINKIPCSIISERNSFPEILIAIKNLQKGYIQIPKKLFQGLLKTETPLKTAHITTKNINIYALTHREIELLHLLAKGLLYKEIAKRMGIKLGSVKQYTHIIYTKLGVTNRTEALNLLFSVK
jgi:DNA-binding NarL/FixJ family response regulator